MPPSEVITVFFEKLTDADPDGTVLQEHAAASLSRLWRVLRPPVVIGVPLGLLMGWYPKVNLLVRPLFDAVRPIPPIAWIPIAILWLGIGDDGQGLHHFSRGLCALRDQFLYGHPADQSGADAWQESTGLLISRSFAKSACLRLFP